MCALYTVKCQICGFKSISFYEQTVFNKCPKCLLDFNISMDFDIVQYHRPRKSGKCGLCHNFTPVENHHICYNPEQTIKLCRNCHMNLHNGKVIIDYPIFDYLKPTKDKINAFYYIPRPNKLEIPLHKTGNSMFLTIPSGIIKLYGLKEGDKFILEPDKDFFSLKTQKKNVFS